MTFTCCRSMDQSCEGTAFMSNGNSDTNQSRFSPVVGGVGILSGLLMLALAVLSTTKLKSRDQIESHGMMMPIRSNEISMVALSLATII